jgi:hypothetical protein
VRPWIKHAPTVITVGMVVILAVHGRIAQPVHYNEFADQSAAFGIHHARRCLFQRRVRSGRHLGLADPPALARQRPIARRMARLQVVSDRTVPYRFRVRLLPPRPRQCPPDVGSAPIALACAGLLVGVRGDTQPRLKTEIEAIVLGFCAVASVAWWVYTDRSGADDLRPYLLLRGLPLVLIPLWQAIYRAPRVDRLAFAAAMVLYVLAKLAEVLDHEIANALGFVSGHTLKHLIATTATARLGVDPAILRAGIAATLMWTGIR